MSLTTLSFVLSLAAPAAPAALPDQGPDAFLDRLGRLCGLAFAGTVVENVPEPSEPDVWMTSNLVMHVRDCSADRVAIPLHVGEDRSRTWLITRHGDGLRLAHDHRHSDGHPDAVTMYGGDSSELSPSRVAFPASEATRDLFSANGLEVSRANVWSIELGDTQFVYQLERPGRLFRVVFDLTQPVATPPPAWGFGQAEGTEMRD